MKSFGITGGLPLAGHLLRVAPPSTTRNVQDIRQMNRMPAAAGRVILAVVTGLAATAAMIDRARHHSMRRGNPEHVRPDSNLFVDPRNSSNTSVLDDAVSVLVIIC